MLKNSISLFKFMIANLTNMFLKFTTSKTVTHKKNNKQQKTFNKHSQSKQTEISTNSFDEFILICDRKFDCHLLTKSNTKFNQKM